jgi:hypothetical protein
MSSQKADMNATQIAQQEDVDRVLAQDRGLLNFPHYTVSEAHRQRLDQLRRQAPNLYDNPVISPRHTWFTHPRWHENSQMPPFHVHYRQEMQEVVRCLYEACKQEQQTTLKWIRRATQIFRHSMQGLHGHVNIEEYACFPLYQREFPHIDFTFLYEDHKDLHDAEVTVYKALEDAATAASTSTARPTTALQKALQVTLEFDAHLLRHLGEEEEIVVPLSLTEKDIWF